MNKGYNSYIKTNQMNTLMNWETQFGTMDDFTNTELYPKIRFVDANVSVFYDVAQIIDVATGQQLAFGDPNGNLWGVGVDIAFYTQGAIILRGFIDGSTHRMVHTPSDGGIPVYHYTAHGDDSDTVGDWRQYGTTTAFYTQVCTVAGATKGSGTWVTKQTISA